MGNYKIIFKKIAYFASFDCNRQGVINVQFSQSKIDKADS